MRLLNCHIENFGVLSDYDFTFDEGLTTICQSNGFGKSTFAAFMKAMFYGFPRTGARNIVENERKRYDPWQGGKYGGYLEFEVQDASYRVTRYFGKTAAKDTFALFDLTNRQPSTAYTERLGEELFQLDANSFARSTFVPQLSADDMEATTSIRTKLSDLVDDTNDLSNYDTAEKKLRDYRTKFRAYRGTGGAINEIGNEYLALEAQKDQAEQQKPRLYEVVGKIQQLNDEKATKTESLTDLREKIRFASSQKARQINQRRFSELQADIDKTRRDLQEMDQKYPAGYPTFREITEQRDHLSVIRQETRRLQTLTLDDADREIVDREKKWFADTDKAALDIDRLDRDCKELSQVSAKMTAQMLPEELEQLETLAERFGSNPPSEEEIQGKQKDSRRIAELTTKKNTQTTILQQAPVQEVPTASKMPFVCGIVGILLLVIGIACFIMKFSTPGIILLVLGFVALLAAFWLHTQSLVGKQTQATASVITASAISDTEKQELYDLQHSLNEFLLRFYDNAAEPDNKLVQLLMEVRSYRELADKKQAMLENNAGYQARANELTAELREILLSYCAFDQAKPYDSCLRDLRKRFDAYRKAAERCDRYTQDRESASSKQTRANQALEQFLLKYQLSGDTPEQLMDAVDKDIHSRDSLRQALEDTQNRLKAFLAENPGIENDAASDADVPDLEELQDSEKKIQKQMDDMDENLRDLRQERDSLRRLVEKIPAWEDRMGYLASEKEDAEKKCSIIDQTMELLSQAKDDLANSYVGEVERGFKNYANRLMGNGLGNVMVDKDLHLHIDEKGASREVGSFSTGTIDCIVLCMRLALVDALFGEEKPFLILDDPFVNLDDAHMKCVREMLDQIARDHQVVYLVCNTSRR